MQFKRGYLMIGILETTDDQCTLLANLKELRVSPKLSGSGAMFTNIKLGLKRGKKDNSINTYNKCTFLS